MTGRHEIHCHYCPCHFGSLYPAAEFSSLQCFLTSRKQGLWLRLGWGQDCELHLPQGSHRLNWLCFLTCWVRLFVRSGFKVGNDEYSSEFGASLFSFFNACISKGWGLCPLRSERGIILQIVLPKRFKVIPEENAGTCSCGTNICVVPSVPRLSGKGMELCSEPGLCSVGAAEGHLPCSCAMCHGEGVPAHLLLPRDGSRGQNGCEKKQLPARGVRHCVRCGDTWQHSGGTWDRAVGR